MIKCFYNEGKNAAHTIQVPLHLQFERLVQDLAGDVEHKGWGVWRYPHSHGSFQKWMYKGYSRQVQSFHTVNALLNAPRLHKSWSRHFFFCRFICFEDREWFEKALTRVVEEHIDASLVPELHPEPYLVDFLRDAPEPTGEEDDDACFDAPKIYELVTWYLHYW